MGALPLLLVPLHSCLAFFYRCLLFAFSGFILRCPICLSEYVSCCWYFHIIFIFMRASDCLWEHHSMFVCVCVCVHGCWGDWTSRSEQFSPTWFDQLLIELERVTRGSERLFIVLQPPGAFAFGGLAHSHTCKRTQSCSYSLTANTHAHSPPGVPTPYAKSKLNN